MRGIEGEMHCMKKVEFIMEDIFACIKANDFTGLSDKIFWRVYAAYQDGQMHMLIKQQENYREKIEKMCNETRSVSSSICDKCGLDIMAEETGPCPGHDQGKEAGPTASSAL